MKKTIIGTIILLFTVLFEGCASNSSQKLTTIPTTEKDQIQLLNMTATLPATAIQEPPTSSPEPTEISPPTATATEVSPQLGGEHSLITWYYGGEKTMPQSLNKYFDSITDEDWQQAEPLMVNNNGERQELQWDQVILLKREGQVAIVGYPVMVGDIIVTPDKSSDIRTFFSPKNGGIWKTAHGIQVDGTSRSIWTTKSIGEKGIPIDWLSKDGVEIKDYKEVFNQEGRSSTNYNSIELMTMFREIQLQNKQIIIFFNVTMDAYPEVEGLLDMDYVLTSDKVEIAQLFPISFLIP